MCTAPLPTFLPTLDVTRDFCFCRSEGPKPSGPPPIIQCRLAPTFLWWQAGGILLLSFCEHPVCHGGLAAVTKPQCLSAWQQQHFVLYCSTRGCCLVTSCPWTSLKERPHPGQAAATAEKQHRRPRQVMHGTEGCACVWHVTPVHLLAKVSQPALAVGTRLLTRLSHFGIESFVLFRFAEVLYIFWIYSFASYT